MRLRALPLLLLLVMPGACYRDDSREILLQIPEASAEERIALRGHLLKDHDLLPEHLHYFQEIRVESDPPGLWVRYNARSIARRNIEEKIHALGFRVNDLPGDPERLRSYRVSTAAR